LLAGRGIVSGSEITEIIFWNCLCHLNFGVINLRIQYCIPLQGCKPAINQTTRCHSFSICIINPPQVVGGAIGHYIKSASLTLPGSSLLPLHMQKTPCLYASLRSRRNEAYNLVDCFENDLSFVKKRSNHGTLSI